MHVTVPDQIHEQVVLRAPLARVWRAVSDVREFGAWFGMALEAPFVAGTTVVGRIRPTTVEGGTLLEITESGFGALPPGRGASAFEADEGGWDHQLRLVAAWVEGHAG